MFGYNNYKYYNPSSSDDETFDYDQSPFHISYETNVHSSTFGPSCIRITFDNVDAEDNEIYNVSDTDFDDNKSISRIGMY